ncbi:MAG: hypothetical protein QNL01_07475 [Akkermansiaceae bacterium]|jgi:hypothetical protein|tara:strand:- start:16239 stop:16679 length:441 start_codon:yes stop_codon:yes gene_type:complete
MKLNKLFNRLFLPVFTASLAICQPIMADDDEDQTPLAKAMEQSSDALKSLRKMDKSDWAGGAKAARTAADGCRKGMEFIPVLVEEMKDGEEKTKAIADYRRLMGLSYAALCELELAYLEKDQAKVDAAMTKIKAGKKEGHKKYEDD